MANYRYEEERTRGQRGMSRRGGWGERGRLDDDEQNEGERFGGGQHYGRDYGPQGGRYGGGYESGWRGQGTQGGSLGGRQSGGYDDDENYGSSFGDGGEYGNSGSGRGQGRGWGSQRAWQGYQSGGYQRGGYQGGEYQGGGYQGGGYQGGGYQGGGYQGGGYEGGGGYQGGGYQGGGYQGGRYQGGGYQGGGYQGGGYEGGGYGRSGSYGGSQGGGQGGVGGSQADGWTREPDEMRWGRQQGLYGSSEIGGGMSSYRSQREYQSHIGKGPKGWQRSDERLREEVSEALARHPEIDASEIEVRVQNGEVTLTGNVQERKAKRMAEDVAEEVFGVKDVQNQIKVTGGLMNKLFGGDKDVTGGAEREGRSPKDRTTETEEGTSRRSTASSSTTR